MGAEADMNSDGVIEYEEFIPLALQIIQSMYAKKKLEHHMAEVREHAEDLLVHGMSKHELTELVETIFERMDTDGSGTLSKEEFVAALTSMELGLTRREINTIMFQIDVDQDGKISYREFVPFAYDLLQKLTSLRLLETELENDELGQYLTDLFKAKDTEMAGMLHADDIRDLLHEAMLGLGRMQIYTVISEAEPDTEMMISYPAFIPKAWHSFGQCFLLSSAWIEAPRTQGQMRKIGFSQFSTRPSLVSSTSRSETFWQLWRGQVSSIRVKCLLRGICCSLWRATSRLSKPRASCGCW